MDGVDSSFGEHNGAAQSSGLSGFAYINNVSVDAIQEIKTSSSAFSAEYGRATGGVIVMTTKSGTNQFHGTASYNLVRGPNAWGFDASIIKSFKLWERHQIQFRTELFNAFNHANDNNPNLAIYAGTFDAAGVPVKNPNFGLIGGRSGNRNIQFGLKYIF